MKRLLPFAVILILFTASCSNRDDVQEEEWQGQEEIKIEAEAELATLFQEVSSHSVLFAALLEKSWTQTATEAEISELAILIANSPIELREKIDSASSTIYSWWDANERQGEIDEEAGASPLLKFGGVALGIIGLLGVPTSGPLAPAMAWLTPLLRMSRMRNEVKRDETRTKFALK